MLFSAVHAGTDDGELDRVSDLVGSVLAGNLSNDPQRDAGRTAGHRTPPPTRRPSSFGAPSAGLSAEIEMRRGAAAAAGLAGAL